MDSSGEVFRTRTSRWRTLAYLLVILLVWVGLTLLVRRELSWLLDPVAIRQFIVEFGPLAPLAFVVLQAVQVVVAPIPGQVLSLAAGYLFGTLLGTAVSVVGATIGSYVAFRLSRHYGRSYVERVVEPEFLERFDGLAGRHGLKVLFLVFLIPGLPDDVICFTAGLTDLDIRRMVVVSFVGRFPGYFLVAVAGAGIANEQFVLAGLVLAVLIALSVVTYLERDWILTWLEE